MQEDSPTDRGTREKVETRTPAREAARTTEVHQTNEKLVATETARTDMSASTIARLMGVATATDLHLLEGKIDLLATKINGFAVRIEKILSAVANMPTGSDLERIDVQLGTLKSIIKDSMAAVVGAAQTKNEKPTEPPADVKKS